MRKMSSCVSHKPFLLQFHVHRFSSPLASPPFSKSPLPCSTLPSLKDQGQHHVKPTTVHEHRLRTACQRLEAAVLTLLLLLLRFCHFCSNMTDWRPYLAFLVSISSCVRLSCFPCTPLSLFLSVRQQDHHDCCDMSVSRASASTPFLSLSHCLTQRPSHDDDEARGTASMLGFSLTGKTDSSCTHTRERERVDRETRRECLSVLTQCPVARVVVKERRRDRNSEK